MVRGLYIGASGMLAQQRRTDILANNLANADTPGFKRDEAVVASFQSTLLHRQEAAPQPRAQTLPGRVAELSRPLTLADFQRTPLVGSTLTPVGPLTPGAEVVATVADRAQGGLTFTGNPLDLALNGPGYFVVQTPQGVRYTRHSVFSRDAAGFVVGPNGEYLLGTQGPLQIPAGAREITVAADGQVFVDGQAFARLRVEDVPHPAALVKEGNDWYIPTPAAGPATPAAGTTVNQGYVEQSNVNTVREMVELIDAVRQYEINQRLIHTEDDLLGQAINQVGAPR